ncbi:MAG TPA: hypothetical protein VFA89_21090 [Terriglobales bacterium]|nr:hypothetical protein [Terriglobales bacterium]
MASILKTSARNAGQVALDKFCPRCCWYLLRIKKWPFQMAMPGIMFFLEQVEKATILAHLKQANKLPDYFGPFAGCTAPVDFPFRMEHMHPESNVLLTAQVDMILRTSSKNLAVLDLKTSRIGGGGSVFLPQYEIQVIGYSWVTQACKIGKVETGGLIYCQIQHEEFKQDPLSYADENGILVPFHFTPHVVELDYDKLTECLVELNGLWNTPHPPRGRENCADCALLSRVLDFEDHLRRTDAVQARWSPFLLNEAIRHDYDRALARGTPQLLADEHTDEHRWDDDGMWANWDFS